LEERPRLRRDRFRRGETINRNFLSGQYSNAVRGIAFNTAEGWSRDVSEEIAGEVLERAFDADDILGAKRFIDRYITPGEKRPLRRDTRGRRGVSARSLNWKLVPATKCPIERFHEL
jgi:hypothetical protein